VRLTDRLAEILGRYGPGHVVTRSAELAAPEIRAAAGRIESMLAPWLGKVSGHSSPLTAYF